MTDYYNQNNENTPPPRKKFPWFRVVLIALLSGIIGALLVLGAFKIGSIITDQANKGSQVNESSQSKGGNVLDGKSDKYKTVNQMLNDVSPSIVGVINMQKAQSLEDFFNGSAGKSQEAGIGSGVIYQKSGNDAYIVTNNHVVDGASEIKVQLHDSKQVKARLIGKDALTDIAVLKIDNAPGTKAISFADSSKVKTGDSVFAIGNPLGLEFANTVTSGIISANERTIDTQTADGTNKVNVLQTDAAINPGNSGGALVNINGDLVGINSMKISSDQVEGIGFAIPSNEVKITIEQLVKHGKVERPSIGLGLINLSDIPDRYKNDLHTDRTDGVYVAKVSHQDAIKKGDIIIKADGKAIKDDAALRSYLYANKKPGDTMKLTIIRDGKEKEVTVTLGKK
ncbi:S1C family serine protease [Staphylococcus carnosus]|uniref:Serine protease HtrA-like n=1 Tax=Staphylococcus carnosus TaxID=1281 RepID=A0AAJ0JQ93_STACA|nr:trypsin-like peptidase domain-containing protein [Staphylococcus carnosus]KKB26029.1 serine protease [Staphylococcus carnosus]KOR13412.1 serine protease [Staphylococcus carnosus]QQS84994.1 trypsin-like peptidase domain-containing protein [Staphylococcus carnosus]QRQ04933.1 trypsin-like peptidase domain-containing protein [Staphylococcus carnosus]UTB83070.1 serine protease [Staphylococcus carnosus]